MSTTRGPPRRKNIFDPAQQQYYNDTTATADLLQEWRDRLAANPDLVKARKANIRKAQAKMAELRARGQLGRGHKTSIRTADQPKNVKWERRTYFVRDRNNNLVEKEHDVPLKKAEGGAGGLVRDLMTEYDDGMYRPPKKTEPTYKAWQRHLAMKRAGKTHRDTAIRRAGQEYRAAEEFFGGQRITKKAFQPGQRYHKNSDALKALSILQGYRPGSGDRKSKSVRRMPIAKGSSKCEKKVNAWMAQAALERNAQPQNVTDCQMFIQEGKRAEKYGKPSGAGSRYAMAPGIRGQTLSAKQVEARLAQQQARADLKKNGALRGKSGDEQMTMVMQLVKARNTGFTA